MPGCLEKHGTLIVALLMHTVGFATITWAGVRLEVSWDVRLMGGEKRKTDRPG